MRTLILALSLASTAALAAPVPSPVPENEDPRSLYEGQREILSLTEIHRLGLQSGKTKLDLWSGSYWPIYQGSVAVRYRDPEFATLMERGEQWDKFKELSTKLPWYVYTGKENNLSPAEKYDLLIGDSEMSLTQYAWELGEKNSVGGHVKTWRGICDGWSSASQKMPRPVRSVTLKSPAGVPITFYPEDIKALGSLSYARSQAAPIFLGKRCRNQLLGLFTGACEETNPGTFHRALVNRVGRMGKTFIADISPGSEVWNYPIESYRVKYYNVFDNTESASFEDVKESFDEKKRFAHRGRRDKRTAYIVGVNIEVNFRDMRPANLLETDGPSMDKTLTKQFVYDLELDAYNNILGGESFSKNLPDFIWAPNDAVYPLSDVEEMTPYLSLVDMSRAAASKGQPLAKVVRQLFELAR